MADYLIAYDISDNLIEAFSLVYVVEFLLSWFNSSHTFLFQDFSTATLQDVLGIHNYCL